MPRFRKRPVVIDAIQYTGVSTDELAAFMGEATWEFDPAVGVKIATLEGVMVASPFDWIIRGVKGELYPCKPEIFEATYEMWFPDSSEPCDFRAVSSSEGAE